MNNVFEIRTADEPETSVVNDVTGQEVKSFIERVERLEAEKADLMADIKDVYGEAKNRGFDVKALKQIVRLRKMDRDAREELEQIMETYMAAIGMS